MLAKRAKLGDADLCRLVQSNYNPGNPTNTTLHERDSGKKAGKMPEEVAVEAVRILKNSTKVVVVAHGFSLYCTLLEMV